MGIDQDKQVVEISIPSELGYEKIAMSVVANVAWKMGFSKEKIEDLKTAVGEACTHAIEYGNSLNTETQVLIVLATDRNRIKVQVIDNGRNPIPTPLPDKCAGHDRRCIGLYLMRKLIDEIKVQSRPGRNEVQLTSYLVA
ncbi:MAG: ATP-binding protein [Anaerolineae bacterium]|nr:ATP-binding protein [Anaerolineae bacterium]